MTQVHERRTSANPYVETIWRSQNISDGVYSATPDGSWDLIVMIDAQGKKQMVIAGQATKPMSVPYTAGTGSIVISFAPGAYMPQYPAQELLDNVVVLPNFDDAHFTLAGHTFAFPNYENVEALVEKMVALGILKNDRIVNGVLRGEVTKISDRGVQRHFTQTVGMTRKNLSQIHRAQEAVRQLKAGKSPVDAAIEAGYSDQPHLAKSLKRIMKAKPSDVDDIHKI